MCLEEGSFQRFNQLSQLKHLRGKMGVFKERKGEFEESGEIEWHKSQLRVEMEA